MHLSFIKQHYKTSARKLNEFQFFFIHYFIASHARIHFIQRHVINSFFFHNLYIY